MLKQDNECHIVNTASLAGLITAPLEGAYNVTKHGVVSLSETLSTELKEVNSKIKVSVLCPGFVKTNILECEKHRPAELSEGEIDFEKATEEFIKEHPEYEAHINMTMQMWEAGLSPDKAGDIVFEAIKDEALYILTDTGLFFKIMAKDRMNDIIEAFKQNKQYARKTLEVY